MGVREIPTSYEYTCDVCRKVHVQANAGGHYTDSRPPHWSRLTLAMDAYDYQGCAVADGTVKRLLCDDCTISVTKVINDWGEASRAALNTPDAK